MIITIDLIDDNLDGLIEVVIAGWSGLVLSGPRNDGRIIQKLDDVRGVYFLIGNNLEKPYAQSEEKQKMYIGKSDDVSKRLLQHMKSKNREFWQRTCVIDCSVFNQDEIGYLEKKLIEEAGNCKYIELVNGQRDAPKTIAKTNINNFIKHIHLIFPMLGFDFLQKRPAKPIASSKVASQRKKRPAKPKVFSRAITPKHGPWPDTSPVFKLHNRVRKVKARGQFINGKFTVFKKSEIYSNWVSDNDNDNDKSLHSKLVKNLQLISPVGENKVVLKADLTFNGPGEASSVIQGRPADRRDWKRAGTDLVKWLAKWYRGQKQAPNNF